MESPDFQWIKLIMAKLDTPEFCRIVGARIRYLRAVKKMEQRELARATGIHKTRMCRIESGFRSLRLDDAVLISEALRVAPLELLAVPTEAEGESEHAAM